jgi:hypothetical protein
LVFRVSLPGDNRLFVCPIGDSDAEAICISHALYAKKAGLLPRQFNHAIGHTPITAIAICPL